MKQNICLLILDTTLENYASLQDVQESLNGYATESYVDNSLDDYTTKLYVDNNIDLVNGTITTNDTAYNARFTNIENVIPAQASDTNQLADKDFVNSTMNNYSAFYITKNAQGEPFNNKAELLAATTFYSNGEIRVPTRNDYCTVVSDESQTSTTTGISPQTRYVYSGTQWEFQYKVNDTPFTAEQISVLGSGITSSLVSKFNGYENAINDKQDKITISNKLDYSLLDNTPTIPTLPNNIVTGSANAYTIWNGTEAQYNAIATKDANTIYLITG